MNILILHSSGRVRDSKTRELSIILADYALERGSGEIWERDLTRENLPFVNDTMVGAYFTEEDERSDEQRRALAISDRLVAELEAADVIIVGAPIYNFGAPAALKAWVDLVARAGKTFRYISGQGPVGLLKGKKAMIVSASGGTPIGSAADFLTPWLTQVLEFMGIADVDVVTVDENSNESGVFADVAKQRIDRYAAESSPGNSEDWIKNQDNHEEVFASAWKRDGYTSIELDPLDVNQVLADEYDHHEGLALTRTQLWEMEVKKAARPDLFIPGVIRAGTARSWGRRKLMNGDEVFIRVSEQRLWLQPDSYGTVIEACYLNHTSQQVTFIGLPEVEDDAGRTVVASPEQPLFHVVHGVSGTEEKPLNTWRIVHLASDEQGALAKRFELMSRASGLPEYVERYIEDVLKNPLTVAAQF